MRRIHPRPTGFLTRLRAPGIRVRAAIIRTTGAPPPRTDPAYSTTYADALDWRLWWQRHDLAGLVHHTPTTVPPFCCVCVAPRGHFLVDIPSSIHSRLALAGPLAPSSLPLRVSRRPVTNLAACRTVRYHSAYPRCWESGLRYLSVVEPGPDNTGVGPVLLHFLRPKRCGAARRKGDIHTSAERLAACRSSRVSRLARYVSLNTVASMLRQTDRAMPRRRMPQPTRPPRRKTRMRLYRPRSKSHLQTFLDLYGLMAAINSSASKMYGLLLIPADSEWHS